ncbi:hypothetical protein PO902_14215 [Planococcus maritimus]|nr:hypothetical protein [Planococcus sp. SK3692]MDE4086198.1 hypothetical protein [Planococcus maritimus]
MIPITYNKKKTSRYSLNPSTMQPQESSSTNYTQQKEEMDRRKHFGTANNVGGVKHGEK